MPYTVNGIGTTYYGASNIQTRTGECEACHRTGQLRSYDTRHWFVLVFIPLIPLGRKRIIDECPACRRHRAANLNEWTAARQEGLQATADKHRRAPHDPIAAREALSAAVVFRDAPALHAAAQLIDAHLERDAETMAALGHAHIEFGEYDAAADALRTSLLASDRPETRNTLAWTLIQLQRPDEALPWLEHALTNKSADMAPLLYAVVNGFQKQGKHDAAMRLLDAINESMPELGAKKAHAKLFHASSKGRVGNVSFAPSHAKRNAIGAACIAALVAAVYLGMAWYMGRYREVFVVNGARFAYQVSINGTTLTVPPGHHASLRIAEGPVQVAVLNTPEPQPPQTVEVRTPFWNRPFLDRTFVLNPDGAATLLFEQSEYGPNATGANDRYEIRTGRLVHEFADIDFEFQPFPGSISVSRKKGVETRRRVSMLPGALDREWHEWLASETSPDDALRAFVNAVKFDPTEQDASYVLGDQMPPDELIALAEPYRQRRPVMLVWHRLYQDARETQGDDAALLQEYKAFAQKDPSDPARQYLESRVTESSAATEELYARLIAIGPEYQAACHWLTYAAMSTARFEDALRYAKRFVEMRPDDAHAHGHVVEALTALDRIDEALQYNQTRRNLDSEDPSLVREQTSLLWRKNDDDRAQAIIDGHLLSVTQNSGPAAAREAREWFEATRAYEHGDAGPITQLTIEHPYWWLRVHGLTSAGRAADALAACREGGEIVSPEYFQYVAICAWQHGDAVTYDAACTELANSLRLLGASVRRMSEWATAPKVNADDLCAERARTSMKAAMLVLVGLRDPAARERCFALASTLNFHRAYPHLLLEQAMKSPAPRPAGLRETSDQSGDTRGTPPAPPQIGSGG